MTKKMNQPAMNLTFKAPLFFFDVPFNGSPKQKTEAALCIDGFWMMICFCCWCWCRYCFCCCRCSYYSRCWSYYCCCCCCCRCCRCQYCCGWLSFCCRPKKPFHFSAKWLIIQKDRSFDFQWSYNFSRKVNCSSSLLTFITFWLWTQPLSQFWYLQYMRSMLGRNDLKIWAFPSLFLDLFFLFFLVHC